MTVRTASQDNSACLDLGLMARTRRPSLPFKFFVNEKYSRRNGLFQDRLGFKVLLCHLNLTAQSFIRFQLFLDLVPRMKEGGVGFATKGGGEFH